MKPIQPNGETQLFSNHPWVIWPLLIAFTLHLAMYFTGYIQEDAFITFRTSFNLAEHGVYSFNIDEKYPGATSLFYGMWIAVLKKIFGPFTIVLTGLINISISVLSGFILYCVIKTNEILKPNSTHISQSLILLSCLASPAMIAMGTSGMETPFFLFFSALTLYAFNNKKNFIFLISLFLIIFIRVDAIGFCLITVFFIFFQDKKAAAYGAITIFTSLCLLFLINKSLFDSYLPVTIHAKNIAYSPDRSMSAILGRTVELFTGSAYIGVKSKFINSIVYFIFSAFLALPTLWLIKKFIVDRSLFRRSDFSLLILSTSALLGPIAYAAGGVIFPWYTWPYSIFAVSLASIFYVGKRSNPYTVASLLLIYIFSVFTLFVHLNIAEQEARYRTSIGNYLKSISQKEETIFLEPAGYIPFYSQLKTYDLVGLSSPKVLFHHIHHKSRWWMSFVMTEVPHYIIDRGPIHETGDTSDGVYQMTKQEREWFAEHYELIRHFNYKEYLNKNETALSPIYKLGSSADYYVYKKK